MAEETKYIYIEYSPTNIDFQRIGQFLHQRVRKDLIFRYILLDNPGTAVIHISQSAIDDLLKIFNDLSINTQRIVYPEVVEQRVLEMVFEMRENELKSQAENLNDLVGQLKRLIAQLESFIRQGQEARNTEPTKQTMVLSANDDLTQYLKALIDAVSKLAASQEQQQSAQTETDKKVEKDNAELRELLEQRSSRLAIGLMLVAVVAALVGVFFASYEVLIGAIVVGAIGLIWGGFRLFRPIKESGANGQ